MKQDNDAQALTPNSLCNDEITPGPRMSSYPPQYDARGPKKLMTFAFGGLRARHYICLTLFALSLLFVFKYNARDSISLSSPTYVDTVEWESLSETDQLTEAVTALSLMEDSDELSTDPPASITLVKTLDHSLVPQVGRPGNSNSGLQGRLIVIGDIHGMKSDLERLLAKLDFDSTRDHLVCAGDMISKGPDSIGVLKLLMQLGASAVRGNHEDGVLKAWKKLHAKPGSGAHNSPSRRMVSGRSDADLDDKAKGPIDADLDDKAKGLIEGRRKKHPERKQKHKELAKQLTKEHVKWLKDLPLILKVGDIKGMGSLVVVHAGLMPGMKLRRQDPFMVMNIRTINLKKLKPSERHKGSVWTKLWNQFQSHLPENERTTVIYGHDSRRGLSLGEFTKGIDTGCLKGGKLTAFVLERGKREVKTSLVHVNCR
ncbi:hypothetical protein VC83_02872 [Pseudogymnoascus destructans]|uniref:Calcineurin-like phosphoesterase domain-containing protein n=2 Tax=Pseudogymnoascus destructans TaxID=655981 RepID=L8FWW9_PSED2|nr:uncharacterized protein VC83_02872 [Pseudogymnoascus destructans]ELR04983.1 hypothetical protein GMDG_00240 [Pseudogymnoascus destructans 20631-21]OAF60092.1 hypothetical protein VC83_02872 [Pseudogymnoascus destructans]